MEYVGGLSQPLKYLPGRASCSGMITNAPLRFALGAGPLLDCAEEGQPRVSRVALRSDLFPAIKFVVSRRIVTTDGEGLYLGSDGVPDFDQNQGLRRIGVEAEPEGLWPAPRWLVRAHSIYSAAWPWLAGSACKSIS